MRTRNVIPFVLAGMVFAAACSDRKAGEVADQAGGEGREVVAAPSAEDRETVEYDRKVDALRQSGDVDKAVELLKSHVGEKPDHWPDYVRLADIYIQKDDLKTAEEYLKKAEAAEPSAAFIFRTYASLLMKQKDYAGAKEKLDRGLECAKGAEDTGYAYGAYVRYFLETGDVAKAEEYAQKALEQAPDEDHFKELVTLVDDFRKQQQEEAERAEAAKNEGATGEEQPGNRAEAEK